MTLPVQAHSEDVAPVSLAERWPRFPYPGLRPFRVTEQEDESLIFYGRNSHKDDVLQRLDASQFVSVVGPSGCGKSSLVKAGVIPALTAGLLPRAGYDWLPLQMRPGNHPVRNLAEALAKIRGEYDPAAGTPCDQIQQVLSAERSGLWLVMDHLAPVLAGADAPRRTHCVLLLLDQFEEIFSDEANRQAVNQFVELIAQFFRRPHPQLYIVLTMRTSYISQCANFPGMAEILNQTQYITPVLRGADLREAIVRPAEAYHGIVEPELVSQIVEDMGDGSSYDADHLPLMQHALLWLWRQSWGQVGVDEPPTPEIGWPTDRPAACLTLDAYRENGGLDGILERHCEEVFSRVSADRGGEQRARIAEIMFRRLTERDASGRYKRAPAKASEVCKLADCSTSDLDEVVDSFSSSEASFVERRPSDDPGDPLLDVSHEALIRQWGRVTSWADDEGKKIAAFRQLAVDALKWSRRYSPMALKMGEDLALLESWWEKNQPSRAWAERYRLVTDDGETNLADLYPLVTELRKQSKAAQDKADRRRHQWKLAAVVVAALAMLAIFFAQRYQIRQLAEARARMLVSQGRGKLKNRSQTLALAIALEILEGNQRLQTVPEAEELALDALRHLHEEYEIRVSQPFPSADYSPDGKWLVTVIRNKVKLIDLARDEIVDVPAAEGLGSVSTVRWNPAGNQLLVGTMQDLFVLPVDPKRPADATQLIPIGSSNVRRGIYSDNGNVILTVNPESEVQLWNAATGEEQMVTGLPRAGVGWTSVAISADGGRVAFARRGKVEIFDIEDGQAFEKESIQPLESSTRDRLSPVVPLAFDFHDSNRVLVTWESGEGSGSIAGIATLDGQGSSIELLKIAAKGSDNGAHHGRIWRGAFSRDGRFVAMGTDDGALRIWSLDPNDGARCAATLRGHSGFISSMSFSPDGKHFVSAAQDKTVRIWRLAPALAKDERRPSDLAEFARQHLPTTLSEEQAEKASLTDEERCDLGIFKTDKCEKMRESASAGDWKSRI